MDVDDHDLCCINNNQMHKSEVDSYPCTAIFIVNVIGTIGIKISLVLRRCDGANCIQCCSFNIDGHPSITYKLYLILQF